MIWLEILVGLATGIISGCGVGGGTLLLLYLTTVAGVAQRTAAGVNLLFFLCCAPPAIWWHWRHKSIEGGAFWPTALTGVLSAALAAFLGVYIPTDLLRRGFGVMLLYIGFKSLFSRKGRQAPSRSRK